MSKEHDKASEIEQMERDLGLQRVRQRKKIDSIGACLQCEKALAPPNRWCGSGCRDDWQLWNPTL